jgi:hypothetical protein
VSVRRRFSVWLIASSRAPQSWRYQTRSPGRDTGAGAQLAEVPPELEWLANITNEKTRRAYKLDVGEFFAIPWAETTGRIQNGHAGACDCLAGNSRTPLTVTLDNPAQALRPVLAGTGSEKYQGRADPVYLPSSEQSHYFEPDLIKHGLKWSPIKVYERDMHGLGLSTNWRLDVDYLTRDDEQMPQQGVPFTVILTLSDPKREAPVFQEMRQFLQAQNINTADIRTAARIATRI